MSRENFSDKECKSTAWFTPAQILDPVREFFGGQIPLDPATSPDNPTKAAEFYTVVEDGLVRDWSWSDGAFVNPPYGKVIRDWCAKFHQEALKGTRIIALLPCGSGRPGTGYWQDHILEPTLSAICFVRGRVRFIRPDGSQGDHPNYPSQILGFNVDPDQFAKAFGSLGKVLRLEVLNPAAVSADAN